MLARSSLARESLVVASRSNLTRLGWRDIIVVDQGPLFETGGSTSHAPGLVFQINPSRMMTAFARYTVDLWSGLELDGERCAKPVGSLEVAWTPERLEDLKRKVGLGIASGVEAHLLGPSETRDLFPLLSKRILGAIYVPSDVHTKATRPAEAMAREAMRRGGAFFGGVRVTGLDADRGRVSAVHTDGGTIGTRPGRVLRGHLGAARRRAGRRASSALRPCSTSTPSVGADRRTGRSRSEEISLPLLRHQDEAMYFRQERDALGIGSYRHEPLPVEPEEVPDFTDPASPPADMPFTPRHFAHARSVAGEVIPALEGAGLTRKFNGLFSFTQDGFPVLGESPDLRGFWSAQAVWITHAGGVGKGGGGVDSGRTSLPRTCARPTCCASTRTRRRVPTCWRGRPSSTARSTTSSTRASSLPAPATCASPRSTPATEELGAVFFESAGWERPQWHAANEALLDSLSPHGASRGGWAAREWSPAVAAEHAATRQRAALYDLTPFAKFELTGPGALGALERLAANRMDRPVGAVTYTSMLTETGGIKCDLTVTRLAEDRFLVVTGGPMGLHDLDWIRSHLPCGRLRHAHGDVVLPVHPRAVGAAGARRALTRNL